MQVAVEVLRELPGVGVEAEVVAGVEDQDQDNRMLSKTVQRQDLLPQHVLLAL